ncbi:MULTISPECIES: amidohydrolase family protein [unclassified Hyphomicrobium]|uniref:amidohydrolase family protein n=1 Tax=unclassified Hyphomicrobium TaxID=2619925 RepID=UPI000213F8A2|nr:MULTISPECIES: amidohydrolase family protein [unclassified Hyphomicrobium]CCB63505.1 Amidohydrolase [Hyphomicrobium sp. MC1]
MRVAIFNISKILSGDLASPIAEGNTVLTDNGKIVAVGGDFSEDDFDVCIDAAGMMAMPGLIDSHVHITFGDYTPRQKTVGFLESYIHGGITTSISASEVHVPGRPKDPAGVKALAIAARKSFQSYRPGGMHVHAGSVIIEPGLTDDDFADLAANGVWLAKAGFGAFSSPYEYAPFVEMAKRHGMITMVHTGGSSIPGSSGIWGDHVIKINPHVSYHVNGGPIAIPDADFERLVNETDIALQVCTAGNLRTTLLVAKLLRDADQDKRLLIATDTPTGSGIMPLGILYTMSHLASLGGVAPEIAIAMATGNNARVYRLNAGTLQTGRDADIVLIDACRGGSQDDALAALRNGDIPGIGAVITNGIPRFVGRSRNTPETVRTAKIARSRVVQDFSSDH